MSVLSSITAPPRQKSLFIFAALCLFGILAAEEWLSIRHLSITVDEGAHTYAGYQHWKARDFGVNPEHPPLVKLVAALPLLGMNLQQPHPPAINFMVEQYTGAAQLMSQNDGDLILRRARLAASFFTFLLAFFLFAAGSEIFGPPIGLLALALFTFEPNILAHGALVTTDMGVACFLFAAFYAFHRFLNQPSLLRLLLCGLAVGLTLSAKVSGVLVIPVLLIYALTHLLLARATVSGTSRPRRGALLLGSLAVIFLLGYVSLWSFYTFRYLARPAGLPITPSMEQLLPTLPHPWQAHLLAHLAALHLFPQGYLFGWAKLLSNVTGVPAFLFGHTYPQGTPMYFPAALAIKTSLTLLVLTVASPFVINRLSREHPPRKVAASTMAPRDVPASPTRVAAVSLGLAALAILLFSLASPLQIGVRHLLTLYPFIILLAAAAAWAIAGASRIGAAVVAVLLLFQAASSLHSYPDYLPYANEAFGGPSKSYLALTDSNVDWGQQLREVSVYVKEHDLSDCWFAYSNMSIDPARLPCKQLPTGLALIAGVPESPVPAQIHGTVLIGALDAAGVLWGPGDLNPYRQFQEGHPDEMIGDSVLVYHGDFNIPLVSAESHMSVVPLMLRMHKTEAALGEAKTALALDPQSPMLEAAMGGTMLQLGRQQEAQEDFAKAMQLAKEQGSPGNEEAVAARIGQLRHSNF